MSSILWRPHWCRTRMLCDVIEHVITPSATPPSSPSRFVLVSYNKSFLYLSLLSIMVPSESTPLLPAHSNGSPPAPDRRTFRERLVSILKAEGEPTWLESYKWFFFGSWFNVLLVFVPLCIIAHHMHLDVALRFGFSFMAIMPLAKVALYVLSFFILLSMFLSSSETPQNKCPRSLVKPLLVSLTLPLVTQSKSLWASQLYFKVSRRVTLLDHCLCIQSPFRRSQNRTNLGNYAS